MIVEELSEDDVFHRNMFLLISLIEFYALVHSVFLLILCLTQKFPLLCLSKTETTKLRLIFRKHCLCTSSAWQAPDDAQLSTPVGLWSVPISATSWGHSNYSKSLPMSFLNFIHSNLFGQFLSLSFKLYFCTGSEESFTSFSRKKLNYLACKLSSRISVMTCKLIWWRRLTPQRTQIQPLWIVILCWHVSWYFKMEELGVSVGFNNISAVDFFCNVL